MGFPPPHRARSGLFEEGDLSRPHLEEIVPISVVSVSGLKRHTQKIALESHGLRHVIRDERQMIKSLDQHMLSSSRIALDGALSQAEFRRETIGRAFEQTDLLKCKTSDAFTRQVARLRDGPQRRAFRSTLSQNRSPSSPLQTPASKRPPLRDLVSYPLLVGRP